MAIKFTQVLDVTNQRITNLGSPSVATDAVNKSYVDNVAQGLSWKQAVRAASTGNITLASPGATIDGVSLNTGDRFLAKDQTTASENGIYVFNGAGSAATRATDADTGAKLASGSAMSVMEGTVNADKSYVLTTDGTINVGTTALAFTLMTGGSGTTYTGGSGIIVTGTSIAVDPAVVTKKYSANVGDGSSTTITVTHNLNTRDAIVQVYTNAAPYDTVFCEVQRTDANNVALVFGSAPATAAYRVVVHA